MLRNMAKNYLPEAASKFLGLTDQTPEQLDALEEGQLAELHALLEIIDVPEDVKAANKKILADIELYNASGQIALVNHINSFTNESSLVTFFSVFSMFYKQETFFQAMWNAFKVAAGLGLQVRGCPGMPFKAEDALLSAQHLADLGIYIKSGPHVGLLSVRAFKVLLSYTEFDPEHRHVLRESRLNELMDKCHKLDTRRNRRGLDKLDLAASDMEWPNIPRKLEDGEIVTATDGKNKIIDPTVSVPTLVGFFKHSKPVLVAAAARQAERGMAMAHS